MIITNVTKYDIIVTYVTCHCQVTLLYNLVEYYKSYSKNLIIALE